MTKRYCALSVKMNKNNCFGYSPSWYWDWFVPPFLYWSWTGIARVWRPDGLDDWLCNTCPSSQRHPILWTLAQNLGDAIIVYFSNDFVPIRTIALYFHLLSTSSVIVWIHFLRQGERNKYFFRPRFLSTDVLLSPNEVKIDRRGL